MSTRIYMEDNDTFADAFNFAIFGGKQVIQPNQLITKDTDTVLKIWDQQSGEKKNIRQYLHRTRDLLKEAIIKEEKGVTYVLLGVENQTHIHYAMPLRNMLYDAMAYVDQVKEIHHKHQKDRDTLTASEYLSGFHKTDRLKPVVTLILYFGIEKWDGPRRLSEMMEISNEEIRPWVQDYEMALIEPQGINDEQFEAFSTDLGMTLRILKNAAREEKIQELLCDRSSCIVRRKAVDVLESCANIKIAHNEREEEIDMCKAWDDHYESGRKQGIEQGIMQGLERGKLAEAREIAESLFTNNMDISFISAVLKRSEEEIRSWVTCK
ncbi:MAG: Rpn family recombination-promoting nuclease/putative transposase [Eubacteriales bacterium]|nr:Rpn family recombination-promoting nuclease/putative transposase [Eubacteriales bacterium]